jgi:hypothetical protein
MARQAQEASAYGFELGQDSAGWFYRLTYRGRPFYTHGIDGLSKETARRLALEHKASRESLHAMTGAPRYTGGKMPFAAMESPHA